MQRGRSTDHGDGVVDVREAARIAKRSPETIRRWIWSGRLAASRRGNRLLVTRQDVIALARERGSVPVPSLHDWASAAILALEESRARPRGSAADLVIEDRRSRVEDRTDRGRR